MRTICLQYFAQNIANFNIACLVILQSPKFFNMEILDAAKFQASGVMK